MPPNPDEVTAPMDLVNGFRVMSVIAVSVFWVSVAFILACFGTNLDQILKLLWQKTSNRKLIQIL